MLCVLCRDTITTGYGNNAQPLAEGKCCDSRNFSVVLKRLRHALLSHSTEPNGSAAPNDEQNGLHEQKEPHRRP